MFKISYDIYIYVCIYVWYICITCIHEHTHIYIHVYTYAHKHTYIYHTYITHTHTRMRTHKCVCSIELLRIKLHFTNNFIHQVIWVLLQPLKVAIKVNIFLLLNTNKTTIRSFRIQKKRTTIFVRTRNRT